MSKKRCRRKHYALCDPIALAIAGAGITTEADLDKLRLLELSALDSFKKGAPSVADWKSMADVLNLAETMGKGGIGPEVLPVCERAQQVLAAGHARFRAHGAIGRAAGEYEALAELCEFHDLQRSSVSRAEYERAIRRTADRIRSAHPSVKVCIG